MHGRSDKQAGAIHRFGVGRRLEHQLNALIFIALVITGLAQKFHSAAWADWVVTVLGGIDHVRLVHRACGLLFSIALLFHLTAGIFGLLVMRWQPTMVVNRKDFFDVIEAWRFYLGWSPHPPRCDRYDYKQKFEYWGVIMGGVIMIFSGWLLWFPTKLYFLLPFLPGELIPAVKVAHSSEATMAFLVIVIWHVYNTVFSPEVFPLDTSIFTWKISVERMLHEHPLELEKIDRQKGS